MSYLSLKFQSYLICLCIKLIGVVVTPRMHVVGLIYPILDNSLLPPIRNKCRNREYNVTLQKSPSKFKNEAKHPPPLFLAPAAERDAQWPSQRTPSGLA